MASLSHTSRRERAQIYFDVLLAIHSISKTEHRATLYRIERSSGLTYDRLRDCLRYLRDAGLVDSELRITTGGYEFMTEIASKVRPVLAKYGLWQEER